MRARTHSPILLPALLVLAVLQFPLLAQAADSPAEPDARPRSETGNPKPGTDLYGDPLPPGVIARMGQMKPKPVGLVQSVAFSPDGKTLVSGNDAKTIHLWEVATGKELLTYEGHDSGVKSLVFSPDGKTLASGSVDGTVRLWEAASGKELRKIDGHEALVHAVAFSPDGKTLASGSVDKTVRLWKVATGEEILKIAGHEGCVFSVAFSPDGGTLASGSYDGTVRLWEVATRKELLKIGGNEGHVLSVVFSPDGKTLASGSTDMTIRLWEVSTGKPLLKIDGYYGSICPVVFSPDGNRLVSGSVDRTVRFWEAATGRKLLDFKEQVTSVAFSPDGKTLATGWAFATVLIWEVPPTTPTVSIQPVTQEMLEPLWRDLAGDDAARAYAAIGMLSRGGKDVASYLKARLKPAPLDENRSRRAQQLIANLDHDDIDVRDKATRELESMGATAEPDLLKAVETTTSAEFKTRASHLLELFSRSASIPPGESLRRQRAIQVLERIGTKEAREVLEMLEKESPSLRERREAKAALGRLKRKG